MGIGGSGEPIPNPSALVGRLWFVTYRGLPLAAMFALTGASAKVLPTLMDGVDVWIWPVLALFAYGLSRAVGESTLAIAVGLTGMAFAIGQAVWRFVPAAPVNSRFGVLAILLAIGAGIFTEIDGLDGAAVTRWLAMAAIAYVLGLAIDYLFGWLNGVRMWWSAAGGLVFAALLVQAVRRSIAREPSSGLLDTGHLYLVGINLWLAVIMALT